MQPTRAVLLDAMGTLVELEPPWRSLAAALGVGEEAAERAFRAEIAYYREHAHEARDPAVADAAARALRGDPRRASRPRGRASRRCSTRSASAPSTTPRRRSRPCAGAGCGSSASRTGTPRLPEVLAGVGLAGPARRRRHVGAGRVAPKPDPAIFAVALELAGCAAGGGAPRRRQPRRGRRRRPRGGCRGAAPRPLRRSARSPRSARSWSICARERAPARLARPLRRPQQPPPPSAAAPAPPAPGEPDSAAGAWGPGGAFGGVAMAIAVVVLGSLPVFVIAGDSGLDATIGSQLVLEAAFLGTALFFALKRVAGPPGRVRGARRPPAAGSRGAGSPRSPSSATSSSPSSSASSSPIPSRSTSPTSSASTRARSGRSRPRS